MKIQIYLREINFHVVLSSWEKIFLISCGLILANDSNSNFLHRQIFADACKYRQNLFFREIKITIPSLKYTHETKHDNQIF